MVAVDKRLVCSLALVACVPALCGGCASAKVTGSADQSFFSRMGSSIKSGTSSMVAAVTPKKEPPADPTIPRGKAGPATFVAMAQLAERNNQLDEAESHYKKALEIDANHLGALVGSARLADRRHNFEAATALYTKAIKKHPKEPSVHNDLGLCYHRRGMLDEAAKSLNKAISLGGDQKLYRDNLAAVYVEQGKNKEALAQLVAAHGEAIGNYNLAYLLTQKHENTAALGYFQQAAQKDPSLVAARQWIDKLSPQRAGYAPQIAPPQYTNPVQPASMPPAQAAPAPPVQQVQPNRQVAYLERADKGEKAGKSTKARRQVVIAANAGEEADDSADAAPQPQKLPARRKMQLPDERAPRELPADEAAPLPRD